MISAQPRPDLLRKELNDTMLTVLKEVEKKLTKDFEQMKTVTLSGSYVTSNRFCESTFGYLKHREDSSAKSALEATASLTVAKMNDLRSFLKSMPASMKKKMWQNIEEGSTLKELVLARNDLKVTLREESIEIKAKAREEKNKKEERKRLREEKKKLTSTKPKKIKIS